MLAIKQTLYRTSGDSPIIDALVDAAEAGKQVLVIVEIKARFDESANIRWARKLEHAGCHVVYGLVGLKTHCKLAMVVRDEPEGIRRYTHIGTGNYNPKTARMYEDFGLLTTDEAIGEDVAHLFNNLSGFSRNATYAELLVAPDDVRSGLIDAIYGEIAHQREGRPARIRIKANSIVDEAIIDALYTASRAGVPIELLIRGICAVRPGVPGLSETIRVRSVLGRYLEHSRIMYFENGGEPVAWIGSSDLMHRNLDRRVEVLVKLPSPAEVQEVAGVLDLAFDEHTAGWELDSDGTWTQAESPDDKPLLNLQEQLVATHRRRRASGLRGGSGPPRTCECDGGGSRSPPCATLATFACSGGGGGAGQSEPTSTRSSRWCDSARVRRRSRSIAGPVGDGDAEGRDGGDGGGAGAALQQRALADDRAGAELGEHVARRPRRGPRRREPGRARPQGRPDGSARCPRAGCGSRGARRRA